MNKAEYIKQLTEESIALLKEMIAIPSPSFKEDEVCSHISKWLTSKGVEHERIGNNIIAEHITDPENPTLMLCAHIDTVSPCEGYTFDPYKPENSTEGVIQGLGSNDDGASVVSLIASYRYYIGAINDSQNNPFRDKNVAAVRCNSPLDCMLTAHDPCGQGGSTVLKNTINIVRL